MSNPGVSIKPIAGRAHNNGNALALNGAFQKVLIDTVDFDTSSGFNLTNSNYVCVVAGNYLVTGEIESNGGNPYCALFKNNAQTCTGDLSQAGGVAISSVTDIMQLVIGDIIDLRASCGGTSNLIIGGGAKNYLALALLH